MFSYTEASCSEVIWSIPDLCGRNRSRYLSEQAPEHQGPWPLREARTKHCRIRIKEHLDPSWQEWLADLEVVHEVEGTTLLIGQLLDQAALYGVLLTLLRLGLSLLSLQTSEAPAHEETEEPS